MYSKACVETFLKNQGQLFDEPVAETYEEAEEFLEECKRVAREKIILKAHFRDPVFENFGFTRHIRPYQKFHFGDIRLGGKDGS